MSRFFPHTPYAEEQPYSHTLLYSHVLYRGFQTGTTLGLGSVAIQSAYGCVRGRSSIARAAILPITGRWALVTTALMVPATYGRMYGREEIEWRDRSWRLLENKGQVETDDWSLIGTVVGAMAALRQSTVKVTGMRRAMRVAGGAGVGSMVGVAGYMAWRYGVHGGKREG
ncbi:uncharacterized protein MYCFIDRAFT_37873 [Pseudocercospora fijiensis CIRAD86]|uniref:Uncharacterized protein n=1 Tax=Pseudocercospora fijiensis (strain CIRAD86) TaxID=383855 RepID=M2ZKU4_PSEFD|nr:uncharacterized protein MYCFIDRAFT_37873 [Pseudocercospora fijiensis CIRAD86]EME79684.1 hypothetical protein MYCFIDRAFT_37873 [Pseudocercospora fijiensis CIRAD86]